jgi:hypothetical protein
MAAIREAAADEIDWQRFLQLVQRHRIDGMAHESLTAVAGLNPPLQIRSTLKARAQFIAQRSLVLAIETMRLQRTFDEAGIPVLSLKGVALAQLAYGSLGVKQGRDVDLLVLPACALRAFELLESLGYRLSLPTDELTGPQRRALVQYGSEAEFVHGGGRSLRVDLHWQLAYNPGLLKGIDVHTSSQSVAVANIGAVRTLGEADLFAYLCVHGAYHQWSRLKWLADLAALISSKDDEGIITLYRHAQKRGAGVCAGQALRLAQRLFALDLPMDLQEELRADARIEKLAEMAFRAAMAARSDDFGLAWHFLLGKGPAYFLGQLRIACIGLPDVIRYPLPSGLHFLYFFVRVPLSIWRQAARRNAPRRHPQATLNKQHQ